MTPFVESDAPPPSPPADAPAGEAGAARRRREALAARRPTGRWALLGLVASIALIVLKGVGYLVTNSAAMLSDALESLVHLVTSSFALYAVWLSEQPRDDNHPYGHGKIEYVSAGIEGALVLAAGVGVAAVGVKRLLFPVELPDLHIGAAFSLASAVVALAVGRAIANAGTRLRSPTLEADGLHLSSDAMTSFGAFAGIVAVAVTGWTAIDALLAIGLGGWLVVHGAGVVRASLGGLLDEASPELVERLAATLWGRREAGWILPHAAKIHRLGQDLHIDLHLVFPRYWTLEAAHHASHLAADAVRDEFGPSTEVMVHAESCEPSDCVACDVVECPVRAAPGSADGPWTGPWIARRLR